MSKRRESAASTILIALARTDYNDQIVLRRNVTRSRLAEATT